MLRSCVSVGTILTKIKRFLKTNTKHFSLTLKKILSISQMYFVDMINSISQL